MPTCIFWTTHCAIDFLIWYFYPTLQIASCGPYLIQSWVSQVNWFDPGSAFLSVRKDAPASLPLMCPRHVVKTSCTNHLCTANSNCTQTAQYYPHWCHGVTQNSRVTRSRVTKSSPLITWDAIEYAGSEARWNFFLSMRMSGKMILPPASFVLSFLSWSKICL